MDLTEETVAAFKTTLRGALLRPGDNGYDEARKVWNAMIDKHPALIVRCAGVADIINAVNFARTHDLLVAVRGGGHNVAGNAVCDGGLMIDLPPMKSVHVDPARRTARAAPGVTWREFNHKTQAFGLATTGGVLQRTSGGRRAGSASARPGGTARSLPEGLWSHFTDLNNDVCRHVGPPRCLANRFGAGSLVQTIRLLAVGAEE